MNRRRHTGTQNSSLPPNANLVDQLLRSGILDLGLEHAANIGILFTWKTDGQALRILIDARRANARFREPPRTQLSSRAAIAETRVDSDLPPYNTGADVRGYLYRIGLPIELRPFFCFDPVDPRLLTHPSAKE